jgi:site-specific DNA-methyltransferase (adenine-specific)
VILHGDCLETLKTLEPNSVDAICTDPPYGISFMAKKWDYDVPSVEVWRECLRVLKPGGHMLVACGTRTQHRMVVSMEDAGFEIRDVVTWLYGQGFPKSLDISKAIDKAAGAEREVIGMRTVADIRGGNLMRAAVKGESVTMEHAITAPATDAARDWEGWGTALKPACEFWTLARKPLSEPTVAKNVLKWGTGALNIDGCRVGTSEVKAADRLGGDAMGYHGNGRGYVRAAGNGTDHAQGRFPANLLLDEEAAAALDAQTANQRAAKPSKSGSAFGVRGGVGFADGHEPRGYEDSGGASRFFYIAKSSKKDRGADNIHPTCKPTALMAYLCRLITPPGGLVLDPFAGSGSTGVGALREGFRFVGIEREEQYVEIARRRVEAS